MMPTLALSPLPTGIQSMPVAGRVLPEFDLALAEVLPPASTPVVPAAILQNAVESPIQGASAKMTFSVPPTMIAQIPDDVARLLGQDETVSETAPNEAPTTPSIPVIAVRPRIAVGARAGTLAEPESEQAAVPDDALAYEADLSLTDKNQDAAIMENAFAEPVVVRATESSISVPIVVLPSVDKAPAPPSARAGSARSPRDKTKVDADIAINLASLPGKPLEVTAKRQSSSAGTVSLSNQDASTKTVTPLAIERDAKSNAFGSALALSNTSTPSDIRIAAGSPAHGLNELSGAQGVAERHLNLARDTMWLDQLASDIVSASDQTDRISFRLMPAHLGQLDVDLVTRDAGLSVNIATSTEEAGKIVASAQSGLVESLQAQGVRVADTQVTSGNDMSRQNQPQRQNAAGHLIETAFSGADDPVDENDERPDGRFA